MSFRRRRRSRWAPWVILCVLAALFVVGTVGGVGEHLNEVRHWLRTLGIWGPFAFVGLYAVAVVFAVPASVLTVTGGMLFGWMEAVAYVSVGAVAGASISFLIARYLARGAVADHIGNNAVLRQLDELTEKQGPMVVGLLRLVPVFPFFLMNYGLGLTRVRLSTYVFWTWLGMLPMTTFWSLGGDSVSHGLLAGRAPLGRVVVLLCLAAMLAIVVARVARRFPSG